MCLFREPQWSTDESIFIRNLNTEVLIYTPNDFEKPIQRITGQKISKVSLAPGAAPFHLVCYIPGSVLYSCTVLVNHKTFILVQNSKTL